MGMYYRKLQTVKHALQYYITRPNASEKDLVREKNLLKSVEEEVINFQKRNHIFSGRTIEREKIDTAIENIVRCTNHSYHSSEAVEEANYNLVKLKSYLKQIFNPEPITLQEMLEKYCKSYVFDKKLNKLVYVHYLERNPAGDWVIIRNENFSLEGYDGEYFEKNRYYPIIIPTFEKRGINK